MRSVVLVDDHILLRQGLANLVNTFEGYQVLFEADNGKQLIEKLAVNLTPDAILLDINMPLMNGFETAEWLQNNHPNIKILALSMNDEEDIIIKMLQSGAHGYLLKNSTPEELNEALNSVLKRGYYFNDLVGTNLISSLNRAQKPASDQGDLSNLNEREIEFIKLSCSEMSYIEIAEKMNLSVKTLDFYKANVDKKLGIKSRITLVRFAIRHGIIEP